MAYDLITQQCDLLQIQARAGNYQEKKGN